MYEIIIQETKTKRTLLRFNNIKDAKEQEKYYKNVGKLIKGITIVNDTNMKVVI
jgi:hypothetical protein